jgi:hypothetical protein
VKVEQPEPADLLSPMTAEEIDQAVGGRDIGAHRMRRSAAIMAQMAGPSRRKRARRMFAIV